MLKSTVKIKKSLIDHQTTAAAIARDAGVHRSYISHVIAGKYKTSRIRKAIADALGETVDELWPGEDDNHHAA